MLEDRIDSGNDVTSRFLAKMTNQNPTSQVTTSQLSEDNNMANGIMDDSLLEIEYSGVAEEIIIEDKVHDTSPLDVGYKEMNGDEVHEGNELINGMKDFNDDEDSLKHDVVDNKIDTIVSKKFLPNSHYISMNDLDNSASDDLNRKVFLNEAVQDHTYQSFTEHPIETDDSPDKASITEAADKPHKCHLCGVSFSRQSSLKGHIRLHIEGPDNMLRNTSVMETDINVNETANKTTENSHSCVFCSKRFACKITLKCHIQMHLQSNQESESVTNEENQSIPNGDPVETNESPDDKHEYKCIICEKSFSRRSSLTCHYKNHPYEKPTSSKTLNEVESVEDAMEVDEDDSKQYKCYICAKLFARQSSLASHLKLHEINSRKRSSDVDLERRINEGNESLKCDKPLKPDIGESNVEVLSGHDDERDVHKCTVCDRSFPQSRGLRMHMLFHRATPDKVRSSIDEIPKVKSSWIPADIIYEEVSSRKYSCFTKNHQHNEITKLFKCNVCQKCFCDIGNLRRHLARNHRDEESIDAENDVSEEDAKTKDPAPESFSEPRSSKKRKFSQQEDTDEHASSISISGMYKCGICNETFDEIDSLKDHVNGHISDHSFRCETCSQAFATNSALESHACGKPSPKAQANRDEKLVCVVCDLTFSNSSTLKRHMNCHRRVEEEIFTRVSSSGRRIKDPRNNREEEYMQDFRVKKISPKAISHSDVIHEKTIEDESVVCDCCNRTFPNARARRVHIFRTLKSTKDKSASPIIKPMEITKLEPVAKATENAPENKTESYQKERNLDSLKCSCCDKLFTDIRALTMHVSNKSTGTDSPVVEDDKTDCDSLRNLIKCDRCDKFFSSIRALKLHITDHTRKPVPESNATNDVAEQNDDPKPEAESVEEHSDVPVEPEPVENDETEFPCDRCDRIFASMRALNIHRSRHSIEEFDEEESDEEVEEFACCGKIFQSLRALNIHKSYHIDTQSDDDVDETLRCHCCEKVFATKNTLKVHLIRKAKHANEEAEQSDEDVFVALTCDLCDKAFKSTKALKKHRATHTEPSDEAEAVGEFECPKCDKQFFTERSLRVHRAFHTKCEKNEIAMATAAATAAGKVYVVLKNGDVKCLFCDRVFDNVKAVCRHYSVHKNAVEEVETEYKCKKCDRSFTTGNALGGHMKTHREQEATEEEETVDEFSCSKCDRTFASGKALYGHLSAHRTVPEPCDESVVTEFPCEHCDRSFVTNKGLCRHKSTHKNDPTPDEFQCDRCDRSFASGKALGGHKSCHNNEPSNDQVHKNDHTTDEFRCDHCDRYFPNGKALGGHKSCHNDEASNEEFWCDKCDRTFASGKSLGGHRARTHSRNEIDKVDETEPEETHEKTYQCKHCDRSFTNLNGYAGHCRLHRKIDTDAPKQEETKKSAQLSCTITNAAEDSVESQAKCDICELTFDDLKSLSRHVEEHKAELQRETDATDCKTSTHQCTQCDQMFKSKIGLANHSKTHKITYQCPACPRFFEKAINLKRHSVVHRNEKSEVDTVAEFCADESANLPSSIDQSMTQSDTIDDIKVESFIEPSICSQFDTIANIDEESFVEPSIVNQSEPTMNIDESYVDAIADQAIESQQFKPPEAPVEEQLTCEICFRKFDARKALKRHTMWHKFNDFAEESSDESFKCNLCGKIFATEEAQQRHLTFHGKPSSGELSGTEVKCDTCHELFDRAVALKRHSLEVHDRVLTTVKFKCNFCLRRFSKAKALRFHLWKHRNESASPNVDLMPFECASCEKCFRDKDDLLEHVKTHMDDGLDDDTLEEVNAFARDQIDDPEKNFQEQDSEFVEKLPELKKELSSPNINYLLEELNASARDQIDDPEKNFQEQELEFVEMTPELKKELSSPNINDLKEELNHTTDQLAVPFNCTSNTSKELKQQLLSHNTDDHSVTDEPNHELANRNTDSVVDESIQQPENYTNMETAVDDQSKHEVSNHVTSESIKEKLKNEVFLTCDDAGDDFELKIEDDVDPIADEDDLISITSPYRCTICNKTFQKRCHLGTHKRIHNKKTPESTKKKLKKSPIKATVILPTRPHKCNICNMTFRLKSTLMDHSQTHATVTPKRSLKRNNKSEPTEEDGVPGKKLQSK